MSISVGIIGFGTVGMVLADIFKRSGTDVAVYDVLLEDPKHRESLLKKAQKQDILALDLPDLLEQKTYIISTVTTQVAESAATKCVPYLKEGQIYIDCNSTSPGIKVNINRIINTSDAEFVEGVILNVVNPGDKTLHILFGGAKGKEVAEFFEKCKVKSKYYSLEVGKASIFKMLRSIFSKGVEVLILEMLVTAKKAGIEKDLWNEITMFMDSKPFRDIGDAWVKSHATAYERRMHEMEQVIATMKELGITPILSKATLQYFEQSMNLKLIDQFSNPPSGADEVIGHLADQLDLQGK